MNQSEKSFSFIIGNANVKIISCILSNNNSHAKSSSTKSIFNTDSSANNIEIHEHYFPELHIVLSGNFDIVLNNDQINVQSGSICYIPQNTGHYCANHSNDIVKFTFYLSIDSNDKSKRRNVFEYGFLKKLTRVNETKVLKLSSEAISIAKKTAECLSYNDMYHTNLIKNYLSIFLLMLSKEINGEKENQSIEIYYNSIEDTAAQRKSKIENYILQNYNKHPNLSTLSKMLNLSTRQIDRFISINFGMSFSELVLRQRMLTAQYLLKQNRYNLSTIAELSGYSSYSNFLLTYKKYFGVSPKLEKKISN